MVVDAAGLNGGQIRDEHTGVKGAEVNNHPGQQAEVVQQPGQTQHQLGQQGNGEHKGRKLIGAVPVHRPAVLLDQTADLLIDGEHVVPGLQKDLDCGLNPLPVHVAL